MLCIDYPFGFSEMLLSGPALDNLGFTAYRAASGDFGHRSFKVIRDGKVEVFTLVQMDERDAYSHGYCDEPYCPERYISHEYTGPIYFLHDLYEAIKATRPTILDSYISRCRDAGMGYYIDSYLKYIRQGDEPHL